MSEIKLDITIESAEASAAMEAFAAQAAGSFSEISAQAAVAAGGVGRLSEKAGALPRNVAMNVSAADAATPTLDWVRAQVEAIPSEKWVTIRARYEGPDMGDYGAEPYPVEGSYAAGAERVPRDMLAWIHKDEAVLPAAEAARYREAKGAGGQTVNIHNLIVPQGADGLIADTGRETVRRRTAPELMRYLRRSGRGMAFDNGGSGI